MTLPALLLCIGVLSHQDPSHLSETQMLKMGRENYITAYGDANGGSTMAYTEAETRFGNALQHRNDKLLRGKSSAIRAEFGSIRKTFIDYNWSCITVKTFFTGGGTMWNTVYAGAQPNVEELIWGMLSGSAKAKKPLKTSDVDREISALEARVKRTTFIDDELAVLTVPRDGLLDPPGYTRGEALKKVAEVKKKFKAAALTLKKRTREQSDLALEFCIRQLDTTDFDEGEAG